MDWKRAIERNSEALEAIVASIAMMLEAVEGATRISRPFCRAVLRVLHPAEAAVRRLIVIAARGLVVKPAPARSGPALPIKRGPRQRLTFRLFDTRKRHGFGPPSGPRLVPRIHVFGPDPRVAALWSAPQPAALPPPPDDGLIDSRRLVLRFEALKQAFDDLPRQARRLARLKARREAMPSARAPSPLRPGPPPGGRKKKILDVDFVLAECHALAHDALHADTS